MGLGPWGCPKMGENIRPFSPKPSLQRLNSYQVTIQSRKRLFSNEKSKYSKCCTKVALLYIPSRNRMHFAWVVQLG